MMPRSSTFVAAAFAALVATACSNGAAGRSDVTAESTSTPLAPNTRAATQAPNPFDDMTAPAEPAPRLETATLGAGCFWCVEAVLEQIRGVSDVTSGYMGGTVDDPTYEAICTGRTGHAEVVQVRFDPAVLAYEDLLDVFFDLHDPTTLNRQGGDVGTQYRSAIFVHSPEQRVVAERVRAAAAERFDAPIVTEITEAATYWKAEGYHQEYYTLNKDKNPYCRAVITPKLKKLGLKY